MVHVVDTSQHYNAVKVAFLSTGLGNILRGSEISCCTWFDEIKNKRHRGAIIFGWEI